MTFDAWRTYTDIEATFLKNAYEGDWWEIICWGLQTSSA